MFKSAQPEKASSNKEKSKENLFLSLLLNVGIPIFALSKLSSILGPTPALLLALLGPTLYAIYDYMKRHQINPISMLGFMGALIKGLFAYYHLDGFWFAVQEAAIPASLGVYTILSAIMGKPLVTYFVYNESVFNLPKLEQRLADNGAQAEFSRLLWQLTLLFGASFFFAGGMNFVLARKIIVSPAGTEAFNLELAKMTGLSYGVIAVPKMILTALSLWWFIHHLKKLTGLSLDELFHEKS